MATKRWILLFPLSVAMLAVMNGCNSGSTFNVQNPAAPPASNVSIAFQSTPAQSIVVGQSVSLTAVVSNDPNNYGVDWTLACPNGAGNCGTLSFIHTASGVANVYLAPAAITSSSLSGVNVVAYATADHEVNTFAPLTVNSFDTGFKAGNYVLQAQGSGGQFAGVITLDGLGNITAGEQTLDFFGESFTDQGLTGNYFIGNDGRGTVTINDPDPNVGTEIFALVFLNNASSQGLISVISGPIPSATGTMDPQTGKAPPSGNYAFVASGTAGNINFPTPIAFGGILNIDSSSNVTGVTDEVLGRKVNATDVAILPGSAVASPPDSFGAFTFNLIVPFGGTSSDPRPVTIGLTGYMVDATNVKLIENDQANGAGFGATAGLAIGQGAGAFSNASLQSGVSYVFGVTGLDLSGNAANNGSLPFTFTSAGLFQADGGGNATNGFTDTFLLFNTSQANDINPQGAQISAGFNATYAVDSNGRTTLNNFVFTPGPKHGYSPTLFFYLTGITGAGSPAALVLAAGDTTAESLYYPSIASGIAYQQSAAAPVFLGDYGFSFTQQNGGENDGTAQMNANAANTPAIVGVADSSTGGQNNSFLGTFSSPMLNVPFPGTLFANPTPPASANNNVFPLVGAGPSPMAVDYFMVNQDLGFWIETDLVSAQSGQVSFAYYEARTALCSGCP